MDVTLFGRERSAAQIGQFLSGLGAGPMSLLITGEVGMGKSAVIQRCAELATARGFWLLQARPLPAELPLEFAVLADLLESVPRPLIDRLPGPQRMAIDAAVLRREQAAGTVDPRTVATALLALVHALARERSVVLVIDDLVWADAASARTLTYVLRRTGGAAVGLVTAARTDWRGSGPRTLLDEVGSNHVQRLPLAGLSLDASRALLQSRLGLTVNRTTLVRWHTLSGGNPLFLLELAANGAAPGGAEAKPLPESLDGMIDLRLARRTARERQLLLVCALSGEVPAAIATAASPDPRRAEGDLATLVRLGILVAGDRGIRFSHPLLRASTAAASTSSERRRIHERLAGLVDRREERLRHVALAGVGARAAAAAEEAAAIAATRGAYDEAGDLAALAFEHTPALAVTERCARTLLLAGYRFAASDPTTAATLVEGVLDQAEGRMRAEALRDLARYRGYGGRSLAEWAATLTSALDDAGDDDSLRTTILLDLGFVLANAGNPQAALGLVTQARRHAGRAGDLVLEAQVCAGEAFALFQSRGDVRSDLITRALCAPDPPPATSCEVRPRYNIAHLRRLTGELDEARDLFEHELRFAREYGAEANLPVVLWGLSLSETHAGNLERAGSLAAEGLDLAAHGHPAGMFFNLSARALVHAYSGRTHAAAADTDRVAALGAELGLETWSAISLEAHGASGLAVGAARAVAHALAPAVARVRLSGIPEPGMVPFIGDAVEALTRLGDLTGAEELLDEYEHRAIALGRIPASAVAARCRGLLVATQGDLDAAESILDDAVRAQRCLPYPFERARTLLVAGEVHRRARHKALARSRLTEARATFELVQSPLWLARTVHEADRVGLTRMSAPRGVGLTTTERSVADLAAQGLTNSEIAARLFMAQRTVETHLQRTYRKLGVRSRTMMARELQSNHPGTG